MRICATVCLLLGAVAIGRGNLSEEEERRRVLDELALEEDPVDLPRSKDNIQKLSGEGGGKARRSGGLAIAPWRASETGLQWLASLYNPYMWDPNHLPGGRHVSGQCRSSMKVYLTALANGTAWAAKITDASGRYSSQFFFGNDFWLGSRRLCTVLESPGWGPGAPPPFRTGFHVAKIRISLPKQIAPQIRIISLGVCLPAECSGGDIVELLGAAAPPPPSHSLDVLRVRPVPGPYSIWADPKLHILGSVTIIVLIVMAIGTAYEVFLERKTRDLSQNNNDTGKLNSLEKIVFDKSLSKSDSHLNEAVDPCKGLGKVGEIFLSFSILSNGRKILHCGAAPKDSLTCVHGLRFLSLAWVIMVHTYLQIFAIAENKARRLLAEQSFMFQTVTNATFSVDTFFFISGLLVTYLYFKNTSKPEGEVTIRSPRTPKPFVVEMKTLSQKFLTLVGYRFARLTPAYFFVLGCAELAMRYLKNTSVFEPVSMDNTNCDKYWWRNVLYINSLFPRKDMCMLWSWYMANDTQFYVLGIFFLLISSRFFRVAATALCLILLSSSVTTGLISVHYEYLVRVEDPFMLFDELYDKPWMRIGPYLVGMFTGWFLHRTKCTFRLSKITVILGWALSLLALSSLVYGVLDAKLDIAGSAVYVSLGHTAWGAALSWIVLACCSGYGGCINSLLSCRLLHPLSRLTYCAYLIHPVIMVLTSFQMEGPLHLHNYIVVILYFGNVVAAFILSFFISLTFEAPVVRLLKLTMSRKTTSPRD